MIIELSKKVKTISTKESTKDLINNFSILDGAKYFFVLFHCLVFIPAKKNIKYFSDTTRIESWKSNGMPEESIENIATFADHHLLLPDLNFNGHCLTFR